MIDPKALPTADPQAERRATVTGAGDPDNALVRGSAQLSALVCAAVWSNREDGVYDAL